MSLGIQATRRIWGNAARAPVSRSPEIDVQENSCDLGKCWMHSEGLGASLTFGGSRGKNNNNARVWWEQGSRSVTGDPGGGGLPRSGGAPGAGQAARRRRSPASGGSRAEQGRPPRGPRARAGSAGPPGARAPEGAWLLSLLPSGAVSAPAAAARRSGRREEGRNPGAAPRRSRGPGLPARPPRRTAPRSPSPPRPTRSRAASLGEAAAGPPPRAGSSPARLGGPGAPQTATPRAPGRSASAAPAFPGPQTTAKPIRLGNSKEGRE